MQDSPIVGGLVWIAILALCAFVYWRMKSRRRHIGSAAAGTIYDMINEEKRNAVEIIVEDKAAARDPEHADDDDEPDFRQPGNRHQKRDHVRSRGDAETRS